MSIHIFGVRHHGPGCARSLAPALRALAPDIVLIEGPPDAEPVLSLIAHEKMQPPVALLVYPAEAPDLAVFYPFAVFSPEWQALSYATTHGIPARFIDLPQSHRLAERLALRRIQEAPEGEPADSVDVEAVLPDEPDGEPQTEPGDDLTLDPIGLLSEAAGYSDREMWWEHQIEQRQDPTGLFEGILTAMTALRAHARPPEGEEARREAYMRMAIRAAEKDGYQHIAVVCGAWHAPVLADGPNAKGDAALLKGLSKTKVVATWIPWTHSRLSYHSGYGAGIASPGWYQHLWSAKDQAPIRWVTDAARLLREQDLPASSASVIEAVRLAEAIAAMRELPMPGLAELNEAVLAVLCQGEASPLQLIRQRLEVGDAIGAVPPETPAVPLQHDLEAQQKQLRLKPSTEIRTLELDLRNDTDRARSFLLHRLRLLGLEWGRPARVTGARGTFRESWTLQWDPAFVVALIEASVWGNTIEQAATASAHKAAREAHDLASLSDLLDRVILAALDAATTAVLERIAELSATSTDVRQLMNALPALARIIRYGDVRGTEAAGMQRVFDGLFQRVLIGLPGASGNIDEETGARVATDIGLVQDSLDLLDHGDAKSEWCALLGQLLADDGVHPIVRGRCCRLLFDQHVIDETELRRWARLTLSPASAARNAANWAAGLLQGSGMRVLHQDGLWSALDEWIINLSPDVFTELLPLLRRAFSAFTGPERRAMGEKVKGLPRIGADRFTPSAGARQEPDNDLDRERADLVLPVLAQILGAARHGG
jgi:hypothetical protein